MTEAVLAPTATKIPPSSDGKVVVCGSHGGAYAGYLVIQSGAKALVLNDAGVGLEQAGIGCLELCQSLGMAAAVVDANTAMIGEAADMMENGVISFVNDAAASLGGRAGMSCREVTSLLKNATQPTELPDKYLEARSEEGENPHGLKLVCIDSVSLVDKVADVGQIVISGSHGGVVGGKPELALQVDARAAFYNDAGVGKNQAGITRLPALDERDIVAGVVDAQTARIGDGRSTLYDGVLSHVNQTAEKLGIAPGMKLETAVKVISR